MEQGRMNIRPCFCFTPKIIMNRDLFHHHLARFSVQNYGVRRL